MRLEQQDNRQQGNRQQSVKIQAWIEAATYDLLQQVMQRQGKNNLSNLIRDLIKKGLIASGYLPGAPDTAALVREALESVLKPQVDRLASISAKAAQITAASFFMAAYSGELMIPDDMRLDYDAVIAQARKLGIAFVKLPRGSSLDDFLANGVQQMDDVL